MAKTQSKPQGKSVKTVKTKTPGPIPHFPRIPSKRPAERVIFAQPIKGQTRTPLHLVISNGVTLELSPRESEAFDAISKILPSLSYQHYILHDYGRRELRSCR